LLRLCAQTRLGSCRPTVPSQEFQQAEHSPFMPPALGKVRALWVYSEHGLLLAHALASCVG
jgi:hypothetical protein